MDRAPVEERGPAGWQVLFVPEEPGAARRVRLDRGAVGRWRALAALSSLAVLGSWVLLAWAWPRSAAYDEVFAENVALKERMDEIDDKMAEVDRILLRLRLYDAQLDSFVPGSDPGDGFAEPTGDHGPIDVPVEGEAPAGGGAPTAGEEPLELGEVPWPEAVGEGDGFATAGEWAEDVDGRLTSFLASFERLEYGLTRVVEDLEQVRALRAALPSIWPADGFLSSDYGWRRSVWGGRNWTHHSGIDIAGPKGNVVRATAAGRVVLAGWDQGYGKAVRIDHGFGIQTLYGHNSALLVQAGDKVAAGQPIAAMGSTGRSTGPHCHFELSVDGHVVDPLEYLVVPAASRAPSGP